MTKAVRTLIGLTVGVFFLQMVAPGIEGLLVFDPRGALLRPWTFVTYMFVHAHTLTHILFNMLGLYFFGPRVEERLGTRRFTTLYFVSGVSGALLSLFLSPSPIVGASAGVFGVMLAFARYWPRERIYIWGVLPVPAGLLVVITTIIELWGGRAGTDNVAHFAHLGGYAGAFLYLRWTERGRREFQRKAAAAPPLVRRPSGYQVVDRSLIHEVNRPEVDRILDKISAKGVDSLTDSERAFLSNFAPPDDRKLPPT